MLKNLKEVLEDALDNTNLFYVLWAVCLLLVSPTLYFILCLSNLIPVVW